MPIILTEEKKKEEEKKGGGEGGREDLCTNTYIHADGRIVMEGGE